MFQKRTTNDYVADAIRSLDSIPAGLTRYEDGYAAVLSAAHTFRLFKVTDNSIKINLSEPVKVLVRFLQCNSQSLHKSPCSQGKNEMIAWFIDPKGSLLGCLIKIGKEFPMVYTKDECEQLTVPKNRLADTVTLILSCHKPTT
jgi:hypothetical protein